MKELGERLQSAQCERAVKLNNSEIAKERTTVEWNSERRLRAALKSEPYQNAIQLTSNLLRQSVFGETGRPNCQVLFYAP
jgi:hypothetical protein